MTVGFIGLGTMGFPMVTRLLAAGHELVVYDSSAPALHKATALGAEPADCPKGVADRADTVLASLPSPQISQQVVTGTDGVAEGDRVARFVDLSTIGAQSAQHISRKLARQQIAALDSPVSGGVGGAEKGTLAIMVSGPRAEFDAVRHVLAVLGNPIFVGEQPGAAQTMKLINNLMAAATLAATAEVMVMGVKAGLEPSVMIDVLNAGSGATHASRDKFPRAVLPRTFDFGFATQLMVKDIRLYLSEASALQVPTDLAEAIGRLWETTLQTAGPRSDFTSIVKPMETAAGVEIDGRDPGLPSE
ncbi:NAD(P)-dependent oxidoreductase [Mycolicibacillus parakoreensis]|uniref:NAD(P)-dependent oxidoreductase n=1 Tax=Mycolicibacillus parakoreensis TaxID=1069221 RepID=A0ABY3U3F2_9MYCO|nr:NAD(P)-dependent oxidoreductase [Mycolicibacillus parakoreensis]MCV7315256.1 NAD(P)-dependent oxidoreductase [Mycolicibacillus parakoreensis]ULN53413.1 NAD(P)-dependent oxidoreductase [Mycolicibacillus parakoreensis]